MVETNVAAYYKLFAAARRAIREAETPRVVTISAAGADDDSKPGAISGVQAMEQILNQSGAAVRHLRGSFFMENLFMQVRSICERGVISYPIPGQAPFAWTAVSDIADAALQRLVRRDWYGIEYVSVRGLEALCFSQAVAVLEQVLQQPLRYQEISAKQYVGALVEAGATQDYARGQVKMFSELIRAQSLGGPAPAESTSFAVWAQTQLLPLVESFRAQSRTAQFETTCRTFYSLAE